MSIHLFQCNPRASSSAFPAATSIFWYLDVIIVPQANRISYFPPRLASRKSTFFLTKSPFVS
jgi:hypothetical protein